MVDAAEVNVSAALPNEIQIVDGNLKWNGEMTKGDVVD